MGSSRCHVKCIEVAETKTLDLASLSHAVQMPQMGQIAFIQVVPRVVLQEIKAVDTPEPLFGQRNGLLGLFHEHLRRSFARLRAPFRESFHLTASFKCSADDFFCGAVVIGHIKCRLALCSVSSQVLLSPHLIDANTT